MKNLLQRCRNTFSKEENRKIAALATFDAPSLASF